MKHRSLIRVLCCAALLAWAGAAMAADWTQFRGPGRDDISPETGLLKQWPAGGPQLAWKLTGIGSGYSGVSTAAGRIYTMGDVDGASQVIAIDAATHKIVWKAKIGQAGTGSRGNGYPGPRCTPALDGALLYVLNQYGDLVCLQTADGKEVWRKNLSSDFHGKMMSGWDYSESPLVDGDNVVCTPGGTEGSVVALNKKTGATVWRSAEVKDNSAYSSLVPVEFGGVRQYIQLSNQSVYAVAAKDGKLLWRAPRPGKTAVITTPVFKDGIVFVTSSYGIGCSAFKVTAEGGAFKAEGLYSNKDMANQHGGMVLVGDYLYGFSDLGRKLRCLELKTGKVVWEDASVGKCSLTFADGNFIVRAEAGPGTIGLVEATPAGYKEKGRFDQPDRTKLNSWPHPVVSDGKLFIRDQDTLLVYSLK